MTFVKKQCDICGETYDVVINDRTFVEMTSNVRVAIRNDDTKQTAITGYDCCPKCAEEVKKFIDDKRK